MVFLSNPWIAIVVPAIVALTVAVFGRFLGRLVPWVTAIGPVVVLSEGISALVAIADPGRLPLPTSVVRGEPWVGGVAFHGWFDWMSQGGRSITLGWALDGLGAVMLCVVGGVSLMVVLFSIGYMRGEGGLPRYFALIALFVSAMCGLVLSDGLVGLFISWELMGVCSYLLIGFWYERPEASRAATKAFLVTRIGDTGLFAGLALLWTTTGSLAFSEVLEKVPSLPAAVVTGAALLLFLGAVGKSAQFPLHVWLPDAMAGPTPVSALIHAATMVAAGVFLIARTWPLFEASKAALGIILAVGVITALGAAIVAAPQNDIKRVLAFSTVSQLGFMLAALGAGHWPVALFHLVTHAAFKALLFLTSGSLIHACGSQDVRDMGGLARKMPVTSMAWLVGVGALAGIPPLSGFVSKDGVLHAVLSADGIAGVALLIAAALTAFYSYRVTRLALFGGYRGTAHPHEGGPVMVLPLLILAGFAALLGFVQPLFYTVWAEHAEAFSPPVALLAVGAMLIGGVSSAFVYRRGPAGDETMRHDLGRPWELARSGFRIDSLYRRTVTEPTARLAQGLYSGVDRSIVDRVVELTAPASRGASRLVVRLQSGDARSYSMLMGAAVVALLAFVVWAGR